MSTPHSFETSADLHTNLKTLSNEELLNKINLLIEHNQLLQQQNAQNSAKIAQLEKDFDSLKTVVNQDKQEAVNNLKQFAGEQIGLIKSIAPLISTTINENSINREKQLKEALSKKFSAIEQKINSNLEQVNQYEEKLAAQGKQLEALKDQDRQLESKIALIQSEPSPSESHSQIIQKFTEITEELKEKISQYEGRLAAYDKQVTALQDFDKQLENKIALIPSEKSASESNNQIIQKFTEVTETLKEKITQYEKKLAEQSTEVTALKDQDRQLESKIALIQSEPSPSESHSQIIQKFTEITEELKEKISQYEERLAAYDKQVTALQDFDKQLENKIALIPSEKSASESNNQIIQKFTEVTETLKEKITQYEKKLAEQSTEVTALKDQDRQLESKIALIQSEPSPSESHSQIIQKLTEIDILKKKINQLEAHTKTLATKLTINNDFYKDAANKEFQKLGSQVESLNSHVTSMDGKINTLTTKSKACIDQMNKVWAHVESNTTPKDNSWNAIPSLPRPINETTIPTQPNKKDIEQTPKDKPSIPSSSTTDKKAPPSFYQQLNSFFTGNPDSHSAVDNKEPTIKLAGDDTGEILSMLAS